MQKYKFSNPASVVEVTQKYREDPRDGYTMYDCLCRGFGQNNRNPRKTYQILAKTSGAAARMAMEFYRKDCFSNGNERTNNPS